MKIESYANSSVFLKTRAKTHPKSGVKPDTTGKTDVVDFARGLSTAPGKKLLTLRSSLLNDVDAPTKQDRLDALRTQIKSGNYHPSTDSIADSILGK